MKDLIFTLFLSIGCVFVFGQDNSEQPERTEFFAGVSLNPPLKAGTQLSVGFAIGGQYNLRKNNAITVSAGLTRIGFITNFIIPYLSEYDAVPLLIGYKKNVNRFFIEPQIGLGIFSKTITYDEIGHQKVFADPAFFWGTQTGYQIFKRYSIFLRYHRLNSIASSRFDPFDSKFGYGGLEVAIKLD